MNRVICPNGHFYDGDAFDKCPHCAAGVPPVKQDPFAVRQDPVAGEKADGKTGEKQETHKGEGKKKGTKPESGERKGFFGRKSRQVEQSSRTVEEDIEKTAVLGGAFLQVQNPVSGEQSVFRSGQKSASLTAQRMGSSLSAEFAAVKSGEDADEGKTVGYFSAGKNVEPPVGYLICTAGEDFGTGFPLKSGNNSLGRSASMDVVIMDAKVSRERQAIVMYEPRRREFYLRPGESSGLCYLGGEVVLETVKIKQFDRIALGDTELMLFPICCDRFSWDELEEK